MESEEGEEGEWRVRRDGEGGGGVEREESGEKKYSRGVIGFMFAGAS